MDGGGKMILRKVKMFNRFPQLIKLMGKGNVPLMGVEVRARMNNEKLLYLSRNVDAKSQVQNEPEKRYQENHFPTQPDVPT